MKRRLKKAIQIVRITAYLAAVGLVVALAIGGIIQDLFGEPHHSYQRQPSAEDIDRIAWSLDQTAHSPDGITFEALPIDGAEDAPWTRFSVYRDADNPDSIPCDRIVHYLTEGELADQLREKGFTDIICYTGSAKNPGQNTRTSVVKIPPAPVAQPQLPAPSTPAKPDKDNQEGIRTA